MLYAVVKMCTNYYLLHLFCVAIAHSSLERKIEEWKKTEIRQNQQLIKSSFLIVCNFMPSIANITNAQTIYEKSKTTKTDILEFYSPNSFMYSSKFSEWSFSYFLPSQTEAIVYVFF